MKKIHLLILIITVIVVLAAVDYWVNIPAIMTSNAPSSVGVSNTAYPSSLKTALKELPLLQGYQLSKRVRIQHLFEKIVMDSSMSVVIFYNVLQNSLPSGTIEVYELYGPAQQGNILYFKVKEQFLKQVVDATSTINEVASFGHNSFFYNDANSPQYGFLVVQLGDALYGFKYLKDPADAFDKIKKLIEYLTAAS